MMNHGFVTRALNTSHFPYTGVFPDLQGAMPAILLGKRLKSTLFFTTE
jgi:hypothetical protein